jgi:hypothetical protein
MSRGGGGGRETKCVYVRSHIFSEKQKKRPQMTKLKII